MRIYVEAYDANGQIVLGNLDGQACFKTPHFRMTDAYKRLRDLPKEKLSLNGRVTHYLIKRNDDDGDGEMLLERIDK